jgi:serine/threonine protein kinase
VEDTFETPSSYGDGKHAVLVLETMRERISDFQKRMLDWKYPAGVLKGLIAVLLMGLDHLHTNCHIIHTGVRSIPARHVHIVTNPVVDLKPDNVLLGVESRQAILDLIQEETAAPSVPVIKGGRPIYRSRHFGLFTGKPALPRITDFGLAVKGDTPHSHPIQTNLFQAPEVILQADWSYSVDIWNLGVLLWDLVDDRSLFKAKDPSSGEYSFNRHLEEMITVIGPPPREVLERGRKSWDFFAQDDGKQQMVRQVRGRKLTQHRDVPPPLWHSLS